MREKPPKTKKCCNAEAFDPNFSNKSGKIMGKICIIKDKEGLDIFDYCQKVNRKTQICPKKVIWYSNKSKFFAHNFELFKFSI